MSKYVKTSAEEKECGKLLISACPICRGECERDRGFIRCKRCTYLTYCDHHAILSDMGDLYRLLRWAKGQGIKIEQDEYGVIVTYSCEVEEHVWRGGDLLDVLRRVENLFKRGEMVGV